MKVKKLKRKNLLTDIYNATLKQLVPLEVDSEILEALNSSNKEAVITRKDLKNGAFREVKVEELFQQTIEAKNSLQMKLTIIKKLIDNC